MATREQIDVMPIGELAALTGAAAPPLPEATLAHLRRVLNDAGYYDRLASRRGERTPARKAA